MKKSSHAIIRLRQRGFQEPDLLLIENFGVPARRQGNVTEYQMPHKVIKRIIQSLDRVRHKAILVDENDGIIITAYNLCNR